jgi:hypothetical protein
MVIWLAVERHLLNSLFFRPELFGHFKSSLKNINDLMQVVALYV